MTSEIKYTQLPDGRVLLEDSNNNKLGIIFSDTAAKILFADCEKSLIKAAEAMAIARGNKTITFDFADRYDDIRTLFVKNGYVERESRSIISVNLYELLSSKELRDIMMVDYKWVEWIPMREFLPYQFDELVNLFTEENIPISRLELSRFDGDLSGIVYDSYRRIKAFILSSVYEDEIIIECFSGVSKENQRYLMTAIRGIAAEAFNCDKEDTCKKLTVIELSHSVKALLRKVLDQKFALHEEERVMIVHKTLSGDYSALLPVENVNNSVTQFAALNAMEAKLNSLYLQNYINWRSSWNVQ